MSAAIHDFSIELGSDFRISFQYLDIDENEIDLTNYCISFLMKPTIGNGPAVGFSTRGSSTSLITNGWTLLISGSIVTLSLSASYIYNNISSWQEGVYDLYINEPTIPARKSRISTGTVTIIQNNFPECALVDCGDEAECVQLSLPSPSPVVPDINITPTPTPTPTSSAPEIDLCERFCDNLDIDAVMYIGSELIIQDNSTVSGTISINNDRKIQNIELMINKLKHQYPQDIAMVLVPPTGNKILLSAHNKIKNYNNGNGFSYIISNKALPGIYINNVLNSNQNIPYVNILNKTDSYNFNNENLISDLTSWIGSSASGNWTLIIKDNDLEGSGTIQDWRLIMTYEPLPLTIDPI